MRYIKWKNCLYFFWITMVLWIYTPWSTVPFPCRRMMFPVGCIKSRAFPLFFLPAGSEQVNVPNPHFISFSFFSSSVRVSDHHFLCLLQRQEFLHSNVCVAQIAFLLCWFSPNSAKLSKILRIYVSSRPYFKNSHKGSQPGYLLGAVAGKKRSGGLQSLKKIKKFWRMNISPKLQCISPEPAWFSKV